MSQHSHRILEVVASSSTSADEAIRNPVTDAAKALTRIGWSSVAETRGHVEDGGIAHLQVTLKVGFTLDDRGR